MTRRNLVTMEMQENISQKIECVLQFTFKFLYCVRIHPIRHILIELLEIFSIYLCRNLTLTAGG